jgi:type VI secretion system protein ImpA
VSFSFESPPTRLASTSETTALPLWACTFEQGECGPNLEYDNAFLELQQAALGKPETQFEPATPPDWNAVETAATSLLQQSRDLRLVLLWAQSMLHLQGLSSLPRSLHSMGNLLEQAWPSLNPPLDGGDPYARLNTVEGLGFGGSFFQSLRNCMVVRNPRIGDLRLKDFEALTGHAPGTELPVTRTQVEQFLRSPEGEADTLRELVTQSVAGLNRIHSALARHVEPAHIPRLSEVQSLLGYVLSCLPVPQMEPSTKPAPPSELSSQGPTFAVPSSAGVQQLLKAAAGIQSRDQALAAIDQVCVYLEHAEPTNPAQLLLKRARRLIDKNFMQLMKDLAPEALAEVAKIMGVNPDSLEQEDA